MALSDALVAEIAALSKQYGQPTQTVAHLRTGDFSPLTKDDRIGEVCMVVRRTNGRLLTARKIYYPPGLFRLLTGGVAPGEAIEAALLREVAEETSLYLVVRRFLAVLDYRSPQSPSTPIFSTFAFLVDEVGGTLAVQDEDEQVAAFREVLPEELPTLATQLEQLADVVDPDEIEGSWHDWGVFRALAHRAVAIALSR